MGKKASVVVFFVTPALERQRQKDPWPPSTFTSASSGLRKRSRGKKIKVGSTSANLLLRHAPTYINAHAPAHTHEYPPWSSSLVCFTDDDLSNTKRRRMEPWGGGQMRQEHP